MNKKEYKVKKDFGYILNDGLRGPPGSYSAILKIWLE